LQLEARLFHEAESQQDQQAPISICAPQLISKRLGTMLPSLEGEQWSVEWPMLEKWPWPNLEVLVKTFGASTWTQNKSCDDECFFCICTAVRYYKLL